MLSFFVLKALAWTSFLNREEKMQHEERRNTNETNICFCRETKAVENKVTWQYLYLQKSQKWGFENLFAASRCFWFNLYECICTVLTKEKKGLGLFCFFFWSGRFQTLLLFQFPEVADPFETKQISEVLNPDYSLEHSLEVSSFLPIWLGRI